MMAIITHIAVVVLAVQAAVFVCSEVGSWMCIQRGAAADEGCHERSYRALTKEHVLLQTGHGFNAAPKRDRATKIVSRPQSVEHRVEHFLAEDSQHHLSDTTRSLQVSGETRHGSDSDQPHADQPHAHRQPHLTSESVAREDSPKKVSPPLASRCIGLLSLYTGQVQTFAARNPYPAYALLAVLVLLVGGLVSFAIIALRTDDPYQDLPQSASQQGPFPRPRLLGRSRGAEEFHRQLSKGREEEARSRDVRSHRTNASLTKDEAIPDTPCPEMRHPSKSLITSRGSDGEDSVAHGLCPRLIVPHGMEFVFNVPELVGGERQIRAFSIEDLDGQPISKVAVDEAGVGPECGIFLQYLDGSPLAHVCTTTLHERPGCGDGLDICKPTGEVFCRLERLNDGELVHKYVLRSTCGDHLFAFKGNFREKAINVVHPSGRLACATRRCKVTLDTAYYEVRVAACVDAGLMLCGLMAIDKIDGGSNGFGISSL